MPFSFYYTPYLATTLPNYHPIEYYEKLYRPLSRHDVRADDVMSTVFTEGTPALRMLHLLRSLAMKKFLAAFRRIGNLLSTDLQFRAFHEGCSSTLPDYYRWVYERKLGHYARLLSSAERTPVLRQVFPLPVLQPITAGRSPARPLEPGIGVPPEPSAGAAGPL